MGNKGNGFTEYVLVGHEKAEKRRRLDRMTRYYQEAGHTKKVARQMAKAHIRYSNQ